MCHRHHNNSSIQWRIFRFSRLCRTSLICPLYLCHIHWRYCGLLCEEFTKVFLFLHLFFPFKSYDEKTTWKGLDSLQISAIAAAEGSFEKHWLWPAVSQVPTLLNSCELCIVKDFYDIFLMSCQLFLNVSFKRLITNVKVIWLPLLLQHYSFHYMY